MKLAHDSCLGGERGNPVHTREEVVPCVELLAGIEGVTGDSFVLLRTAAWFHDLGFVEQPAYHELISTRIASKVLPGFGYTAAEVEIVRWIVLATIIPQDPRTILEEIMTDADLSILGSEDFMTRNGDLRFELASFGKAYSDMQWYTGQIKFLEKHTFFTESARALLYAQKSLNVAALKAELEAKTSKK